MAVTRVANILILIVAVSCVGYGQIDQAVGEWRSFLPYNTGIWVTQSDDKIYYATPEAILSIDKEDTADRRFMSKVEGLSDVGVSRIEYDKFNDALVIAYRSSVIDIVTDQAILTIDDIKTNSNLTGDRSINDILVVDNSEIYFATAFGIVEYNYTAREFGSTIFTNTPILDLSVDIDGRLCAATDIGIFTFDRMEGLNISDFSQWRLMPIEGGFANYEASALAIVGDELYGVVDGMVFRAVEDTLVMLESEQLLDFDVSFISAGQDKLFIGKEDSGEFLILDSANLITEGISNCAGRIQHVIEDQQGRLWFADLFREIRWSESLYSGCNKDLANTPLEPSVSDIEVIDGGLALASGGVRENFTPRFNRDGFYVLEDGLWSVYRENELSELIGQNFLNNYQVEQRSSDGRLFVGSYAGGLLEFDIPSKSVVELYNQTNSPITPTIGDAGRQRISGLAFDEDENLWVNVFGAVGDPLLALTPDGTWYSFDPVGDQQLANAIVDQNGYVWSVLISAAGGVVVYDHNGTLDDPTDDRSRFINSANSEIETGTVNTLAMDNDGEIWVGTNAGPVIFDGGPSIFDADNRGARRTVLQDSIPAILLETEDIRAISVDGANRKWFGTRNGIFVQSPDGEELIVKYDVDNSPLFDNTITDLEYDPETGIMYIATTQGMQSIRTETLGADRRHAREVFAFPNPIRPDYQGDVYIKGLAQDANVKITDINGKLVYETQALGGQAVWDLRDYTGRRAATGVYYVFSTGQVSFDTPDNFVTKIMIIN